MGVDKSPRIGMKEYRSYGNENAYTVPTPSAARFDLVSEKSVPASVFSQSKFQCIITVEGLLGNEATVESDR